MMKNYFLYMVIGCFIFPFYSLQAEEYTCAFHNSMLENEAKNSTIKISKISVNGNKGSIDGDDGYIVTLNDSNGLVMVSPSSSQVSEGKRIPWVQASIFILSKPSKRSKLIYEGIPRLGELLNREGNCTF